MVLIKAVSKSEHFESTLKTIEKTVAKRLADTSLPTKLDENALFAIIAYTMDNGTFF